MQYMPRKNFGAKLEPIETVLHGAGQDIQGFQDYSNVFDEAHRPMVYMTYIGITGEAEHITEWGNRVKDEIASLDNQNLRLQIGVSMTGGNDTGAGLDHLIANGEKDHNVALLCKAIEEIGLPAYVRIGYEFEGYWNGYQPETYKQAFIRITKALREQAFESASVWCSGGASSKPEFDGDLIAYYPGDEWVDWWGIDPFEANELLNDDTRQFCELAGQHNKPVMIGESTPREVGVLDGEASWQRWFQPYFELIHRQPEIKLFSYINWEWAHWSKELGFDWYHWGDCRIEQNAYVMEAFRTEMNLPLYQHAA